MPPNRGMQQWVTDLNRTYRQEAALHEGDVDPSGIEWIDCQDVEASVISLLRKGRATDDIILVICNFTPVPRPNYRIGAPRGGYWKEILNSDATVYGGGGWGNGGGVHATPVPLHGRTHSVTLTLPALSVVFLKHSSHG